MIRRVRAGALLAFVILVALPALGATAREMYATAEARAKAVRDDGSPSAKEYRSAATAYEAVVRRYPTTGYADNALLQAALLSRQAFEHSGDDQDKLAAVRRLHWLVKEYPASPLLSKARDELKRWEAPAAPRTPAAAPPRPTALSTKPAKAEPTDRPETMLTGTQQAGLSVLKDIRRTALGETVRVTIELDAEVAYHVERVDSPARVFFDLPSTRLGPNLSEGTLSYSGEIVRHVRVGRHPNRVIRVVLDIEGVKKYSVFTLYGPYRIVVDCERGPTLPPVPTERITEEKPVPPMPDPEALAAAAAPARREPPKAAPLAVLPGRSLQVAGRFRAPTVVAPPAAPLFASTDSPAPRVAPGPVTVQSTTVAQSSSFAKSQPPVPLKVTRQFRLTRYPMWQPVVIQPLPLGRAAESIAASAPAASTPAVRPASVNADRALPPTERPAVPSEPITPPPNGFSMARQLGLGAARIVIDPGHGGHDPGAEGSGLFEATVVLDVALRLEKLLTAAGIEAVLTRRTDEYIPLEERTAIANRAQGDLFLSIHANASRNKAARGIESYVLNFASTPDAEAVAARENASTGMTMSSLTEIVKAIALNNKLDESRNLAGLVQREMASHLGGPDRETKDHGVKQAPFVVLIGASMPSVLVEISFITNSQEGRLLKTGAYRQKVAEALFDAIRGYQKSLKGSAVLTRQ